MKRANMGPFPPEILDTFWNVKDHGAKGDGVTDDTQAIQAAMNSGKTTVYLNKSFYTIHSTVEIGGKVRRFHGGWCTIAPAGDLLARSDPMFTINSGTQDTVVIQCIRKRGGSWFGISQHSFIRNNSTVSVIGVTEGSNDGANGYHPHVIRETLRGVTRDMPHPGRGGPMPVRHQGGREQLNLPLYRSGLGPPASSTKE